MEQVVCVYTSRRDGVAQIDCKEYTASGLRALMLLVHSGVVASRILDIALITFHQA